MKFISYLIVVCIFLGLHCQTENLEKRLLLLENRVKKLNDDASLFTLKELQKENVIVYGMPYNLVSKEFSKDGQVQMIKQTYFGEELKNREFYFENNVPFYVRYSTEYYNREVTSNPNTYEKSDEVADIFFFENGKLIAMRLGKNRQLTTDEQLLNEKEKFLIQESKLAKH